MDDIPLFDMLGHCPTTDDEAHAWLALGRDPFTATQVQRLYTIARLQGTDILTALSTALEAEARAVAKRHETP